MSLLADIIRDATDDKVPLTSLLRKCLVLAHKLKSEEFSRWVNNELEGYSDDPVPPYRLFERNHFVGNFNNGYWSHKEHPITEEMFIIAFPDNWQDILAPIQFSQPIARIEETIALTKRDPSQKLGFPLPPMFLARLSNVLQGGYQCTSASSNLSVDKLQQVLDTVRTKVLKFTMNIADKDPNAGDVASTNPSIPREEVRNMVNQNIYGGTFGNIANASNNFQQSADVSVAAQQVNIDVDLAVLQGELKQLLTKLALEAEDQDQFDALAQFKAAETASAANDKNKVVERLQAAGAKVGPWLLGAATSIGAGVAAKAIGMALGLH